MELQEKRKGDEAQWGHRDNSRQDSGGWGMPFPVGCPGWDLVSTHMLSPQLPAALPFTQPLLGPGCTGSPSFLPRTACFPPTPFCSLSYIVTPPSVPWVLQHLPLKSTERMIRSRWWEKCSCKSWAMVKSLAVSESEGPKWHLQNLPETIAVVGLDKTGSASSGGGESWLVYLCPVTYTVVWMTRRNRGAREK